MKRMFLALALVAITAACSSEKTPAPSAAAVQPSETSESPTPDSVVPSPTPAESARVGLVSACSQYCAAFATSARACHGGVNTCLSVEELDGALAAIRADAETLVTLGQGRFSAVVDAVDTALAATKNARDSGCADGMDWRFANIGGGTCQLAVASASLAAGLVALALQDALASSP
jgi:putative hemolysin